MNEQERLNALDDQFFGDAFGHLEARIEALKASVALSEDALIRFRAMWELVERERKAR